jgi:hypothetical protein
VRLGCPRAFHSSKSRALVHPLTLILPPRKIVKASSLITFRSTAGAYFTALLIAASLPLRADEGQKSSARAVIDKYCITCHNAKLKTAGLQLDTADIEHVDVEQIGQHADLWEKVARKLRTGEMPPAGLPRPDKATYAGVATELEAGLDAAALAKPNPGRVAVHRLNRAEYTAAVRDLLALDIDGKAKVCRFLAT